MRLSIDEFNNWANKSITLLGMSGVGKTHLSTILRRHDWFHYSGDYRIGTRYLDEPILDNIKQQAMEMPFLRDLLRSDSIYIGHNITVDNLEAVLSFVGKPGDPSKGGLPIKEFERRQELYRLGEIAAMKDVPDFIRKAQQIYGYKNFVNDVGGSLCELEDSSSMDVLIKHTLVLYIQVSAQDEAALIERAEADPKPLYYRPVFLEQQLGTYLEDHGLSSYDEIDPDDFTRWVFPRLFQARVPRYESIAGPHGYTVTSAEISRVRDDKDFLSLLESAIVRCV
jgi:hypothetical protein